MLWTEYCPVCDKNIIVVINDTTNFETICPRCSNRLMLCSICQETGHRCDWDEEEKNRCSKMYRNTEED